MEGGHQRRKDGGRGGWMEGGGGVDGGSGRGAGWMGVNGWFGSVRSGAWDIVRFGSVGCRFDTVSGKSNVVETPMSTQCSL